jgi:hypothetical protein
MAVGKSVQSHRALSSAHQPRCGWSFVDIIFQEQASFKRQERSKEENSRPIYQERLVLSQSTFGLDSAKGAAAYETQAPSTFNVREYDKHV